MKKIISGILLLVLVNSCLRKKSDIVRIGLEGMWIVDTIYYKNYNIKACILINSIYLKFDEKSSFPTSENRCSPIIRDNFNDSADIVLSSSKQSNDNVPYRLLITKNNFFAGSYKIVFYKDPPTRTLVLEIWSKDFYIVCRKSLFVYDDNVPLMNELEYLTWKDRPKS